MKRTDELLKSAEVASLLRVHPKHVYRLLKQGLPARRVGGEWRFSREQVLDWSGARGAAPSRAEARIGEEGALRPPPPLIAANGDVVMDVLLGHLRRASKPLVGMVPTDRGEGLELLAERQVLMAGFHGDRSPAHLRAERLARIHLVRRDVGLAHGKSVTLRSLQDLAHRRLAVRPKTAGVSKHLQHALAEASLSLKGLAASQAPFASHREAVSAVLRREADIALTTSAWAARVGLRFFALAQESYDLLLFADYLGERAVVGVCEVTQSRAFRTALAEVPGYEPRAAGEIRYEPAAH